MKQSEWLAIQIKLFEKAVKERGRPADSLQQCYLKLNSIFPGFVVDVPAEIKELKESEVNEDKMYNGRLDELKESLNHILFKISPDHDVKFSYRRTNWSQAVTYFRSATDTRKTLDSICEEKLNVCRFTFVQVKKQGKLYCLDRFSGYFPPADWLHTPELQRYYFCSWKLRADQIERLEQMSRVRSCLEEYKTTATLVISACCLRPRNADEESH